ncbi:MAG: cheY3 [Clostridiaceae bacterium]|jgi:two-component system chemotaxis response regulator CheY|nr:cheY3 [Clostridiaceae bacterium]
MKRVMIVDDSKFMHTVLGGVLKTNGYEVVCNAYNGVEAIEKYKTYIPDIITMDITMPEMGGIEALKNILKINPNAKVVMVSAMGQESLVLESVTAGAKGFIVKPFKSDVVATALSKFSN